MTQDPSAIVVPFGKYRGSTVAELLARDPDYVQWLMGQGWLAQRFAELHAAILTRGASPDDTPEHNKLQARFLDKHFRVAFLLSAAMVVGGDAAELEDAVKVMRIDRAATAATTFDRKHHNMLNPQSWWSQSGIDNAAREEALAREQLSVATECLTRIINPQLATRAAFEQGGIDVVLSYQWRWDSYELTLFHDWPDTDLAYSRDVPIELKPTLGDDYPSVIRQLRRLKCEWLVVDRYTGAGTSFDNVRKMITASGAEVITLQEIEAELAEARTLPLTS